MPNPGQETRVRTFLLSSKGNQQLAYYISDSRINQQLIHTHNDSEEIAWISYSIIKFFRNLAIFWGTSRHKLVLDAVAMEPELPPGTVQEIESVVRIRLGPESAL